MLVRVDSKPATAGFCEKRSKGAVYQATGRKELTFPPSHPCLAKHEFHLQIAAGVGRRVRTIRRNQREAGTLVQVNRVPQLAIRLQIKHLSAHPTGVLNGKRQQ